MGQTLQPLNDSLLVVLQGCNRQFIRQPQVPGQTPVLLGLHFTPGAYPSPLCDAFAKLVDTGPTHLQIALPMQIDHRFLRIELTLAVLPI
ncbi:hypothetical protein D3C85_949870 [compost metagenome]